MTTASVVPPRGAPAPGADLGQAVRRGFAQYATFEGRASRSEFWLWQLFVGGSTLVLAVPPAAVQAATRTPDDTGGPALVVGTVLVMLFYAAVALPTLAVACRRLHDAGLGGVYLLLGLVTPAIPLVLCAMPTSPAAGRVGPPVRAGAPAPAHRLSRTATSARRVSLTA